MSWLNGAKLSAKEGLASALLNRARTYVYMCVCVCLCVCVCVCPRAHWCVLVRVPAKFGTECLGLKGFGLAQRRLRRSVGSLEHARTEL